MPLGVRTLAAARGLALSIEPADAEDILQRLGASPPPGDRVRAAGRPARGHRGARPRRSIRRRTSSPPPLFAALAEDDFDAQQRLRLLALPPDVRRPSARRPRARWRWLAKRIPAEPSRAARASSSLSWAGPEGPRGRRGAPRGRRGARSLRPGRCAVRRGPGRRVPRARRGGRGRVARCLRRSARRPARFMGAGARSSCPRARRCASRRAGPATSPPSRRARTSWSAGYLALRRPSSSRASGAKARAAALDPVDLSRIVSARRRAARARARRRRWSHRGPAGGARGPRRPGARGDGGRRRAGRRWSTSPMRTPPGAGRSASRSSSRTSTERAATSRGRCLRRRLVLVASRPRAGGGSLPRATSIDWALGEADRLDRLIDRVPSGSRRSTAWAQVARGYLRRSCPAIGPRGAWSRARRCRTARRHSPTPGPRAEDAAGRSDVARSLLDRVLIARDALRAASRGRRRLAGTASPP